MYMNFITEFINTNKRGLAMEYQWVLTDKITNEFMVAYTVNSKKAKRLWGKMIEMDVKNYKKEGIKVRIERGFIHK